MARAARQIHVAAIGARAPVRRGLTRCRSPIDRWETGKSEPSASEAALRAVVLAASLDQLFTVDPIAHP